MAVRTYTAWTRGRTWALLIVNRAGRVVVRWANKWQDRPQHWVYDLVRTEGETPEDFRQRGQAAASSLNQAIGLTVVGLGDKQKALTAFPPGRRVTVARHASSYPGAVGAVEAHAVFSGIRVALDNGNKCTYRAGDLFPMESAGQETFRVRGRVRFDIAEGHAVGVATIGAIYADRDGLKHYRLDKVKTPDVAAVDTHRDKGGELWVLESELAPAE